MVGPSADSIDGINDDPGNANKFVRMARISKLYKLVKITKLIRLFKVLKKQKTIGKNMMNVVKNG